jgi:hypothetical protein
MHRLAVRREHVRRLDQKLPDKIQPGAAWFVAVQHCLAHGFHELKRLRDRFALALDSDITASWTWLWSPDTSLPLSFGPTPFFEGTPNWN